MLLTIVKDSIMLFLLIYALLSLTEKLVLLLKRFYLESPCSARKFHVIDISHIQTGQIEYTLRKELTDCKNPVFLIIGNISSETEAIIARLQRKYNCLHPISRSELLDIIASPIALDAFLEAVPVADPNLYK